MRKALGTALCLILMLPASGRTLDGNLHGRWKITAPTDATYSGDLVIDHEGRAVATGTSASRSGTWIGYVEHADTLRVEIVLTDHKTVLRVRCLRPARDVLNCDNTSADGALVSGMYYMRR